MFRLWFLYISSFLGFLGWLHLCYLLKIYLVFIKLIYFNNFWWASAWMMIILHLPDKCTRYSVFFCTWFSRYLNKKEEVCFLELITYLGQLPLTSTLTYIPFTSVYARKKQILPDANHFGKYYYSVRVVSYWILHITIRRSYLIWSNLPSSLRFYLFICYPKVN